MTDTPTIGSLGTGKTLAAAALIMGFIVTAVTLLHFRAAADDTGTATPPLPVNTLRLELSDHYEVKTHYAGQIEAARSTPLSFERGGLVTEVLVEEGDLVAEGDVIARLDTAALLTERDRLTAQIAETEANLELARRTEIRQKALAAKGHTSQQRYDEARLNRQSLEARLQQAEAALEALDIEIAKSEVTAPFAASITSRHVDEGTVVAAGTPLVGLLETARRLARVGVPPDVAARLNDEASYTIRNGDSSYPARLAAKRPDIRANTRTVDLLLEIAGNDAPPFGEIVDLVINSTVKEQGAWLPMTALIEGRKGLWDVYIAAATDTGWQVGRESVEIIHVDNERVYVRGTVKEGERVITDGVHRIIPGQAIALNETLS